MPRRSSDSTHDLSTELDEMAGVIEGLTTLARAKRAALVTCNLKVVDAISTREEKLMDSACRHANAIHRARNNPGNQDDSRPEAPGITKRKARLRELATELAHETRLTALLARKSIAHFAGLLEILTGTSSHPMTYSPGGQERRSAGTCAMVDARV